MSKHFIYSIYVVHEVNTEQLLIQSSDRGGYWTEILTEGAQS